MRSKLIVTLMMVVMYSSSMAQVATGIISSVSPIMTVITVTKYLTELFGQQVPEYVVKIQITTDDQKTAMKMAFKEACQKAFGSVISSDLESNHQRLTHDNVTNYSSCYVKDYNIISKEQISSDEFTLIADITVSSNKIDNRALGDSSVSNQFDGEKHNERLSTYRDSKVDEDSLLTSVLRDYPTRAFNLQIDGSRTMMDHYRNGRIEINFVADLNHDYINALHDTFKVVGNVAMVSSLDKKPINSGYPTISILSESHSYFIGSNKTTYYEFSDVNSYNTIQNRLGSPINLLIQVRNQSGDWQNMSCILSPFNNPQAHPNLVNFGYNYTGILNASSKLKYTLSINISSKALAKYISQISDIRLSLTLQDCSNGIPVSFI